MLTKKNKSPKIWDSEIQASHCILNERNFQRFNVNQEICLKRTRSHKFTILRSATVYSALGFIVTQTCQIRSSAIRLRNY